MTTQEIYDLAYQAGKNWMRDHVGRRAVERIYDAANDEQKTGINDAWKRGWNDGYEGMTYAEICNT